ncbi:MAG TPA: amidohydrolase family protein [Chloroflexota bacterium]|jgi:predicted TIM-barrel fold metal-dependent hydrolase
MRDGFLVIDADRHIIEPADLWDRYMDPPFRGRVQILGPGQGRRLVDGELVSDAFRLPGEGETRRYEKYDKIFSGDEHYRTVFGEALAADFDPPSNLRDMDREGVDVSVLFPTMGLYIIWKSDMDPQVSAAICRAYNNWLSEYCSYDPTRLKGVMLIPLQDTQLAVEELKRAAGLGLCGVFWRPNPVKGRKLDHPDYQPIYETAADLGVVICVHEGARTILPQAGSDRYSEFTRHIACHPLEQMLACATFCADGTLERLPELKVAHLESSCGWLPFWLERMDEHWEHYSMGKSRSTSEPPSYYFKRQCWISCEAGEELAGVVAEHVSPDCLIMATDYPHPDAVDKFPDRTVGDLTRNAELSADLKRKILWDNPARLYGIKEAPKSAAAGQVATPAS